MLTRIALSTVLVLGAASVAMADVAEKKEGDIYPASFYAAPQSGFNAFASTRAPVRAVVNERGLYDRHASNGW
ncbi:MAG: hypothetical protein FJX62_14120 [Alphaproteobacteria bacterium]|nr:hypothetical protein [Alphaproteobacteria bacterium]